MVEIRINNQGQLQAIKGKRPGDIIYKLVGSV
jgi:hypothetical protein